MGRRYLSDVVDKAVQTRVKAQGDNFNADSYRQILTLSGDIDHILEEIDSYERLAKEKWTSGRQTQPTDPNKDNDPEKDQDNNDNTDDESRFVDLENENFFEKDGAK